MVPFTMQMNILLSGYFKDYTHSWLPQGNLEVNTLGMTNASYAAVSFLITLGAILGRVIIIFIIKASPAQIIFLAIIHAVLYSWITCIF